MDLSLSCIYDLSKLLHDGLSNISKVKHERTSLFQPLDEVLVSNRF